MLPHGMSDNTPGQQASAAQITITPGNNTANADVDNGVSVTVTSGKLTSVGMTTVPTGTPVTGTISGDGTLWQPDMPLARGTMYMITARAMDAWGQSTTLQSSFKTTLPARSSVEASLPEDGSTIGVGMPVSLNFPTPITNRKAVQSAITVVSSSGQHVVGHWFGKNRLDFRPRTYWKTGSDITVKLRLSAIPGAHAPAGVKNKTIHFHIGRSQVSTVDVRSKTMTVVRDGKIIKVIPISAGAPGTPTYNGQMVISQKDQETRMNGATVGFTDEAGTPEYDIPDVPHALRLSGSGTFLHGNYWASKAVFGRLNSSHGCIGLSDIQGGQNSSTPAAWFFDHSLIGDVVIVQGSNGTTIKPDNGFGDWNMTWNEWKARSAV
jgi:hypothetical protein